MVAWRISTNSSPDIPLRCELICTAQGVSGREEGVLCAGLTNSLVLIVCVTQTY
jgi:hypothetical protein